MESADSGTEATKIKVPHSSLAFDANDIVELRLYLKSMQDSYRDQTLENERIKDESLDLKKRNDYLEVELVQRLEVEKVGDNAILIKTELLKKHDYLESELAKERILLKLGLILKKLLLKSGFWREGLGYSNKKKPDKNKSK